MPVNTRPRNTRGNYHVIGISGSALLMNALRFLLQNRKFLLGSPFIAQSDSPHFSWFLGTFYQFKKLYSTHPGCCLLWGCLCGTYIRRWLKGVGVYLKFRKWKWCILALLGCTLALLGCILALSECFLALLGCILALLGCILALPGCILALLFCRWLLPAVGRLPTLLVFSTRLNNLIMKTTMTKIEIKVVVSSNMMFVVAC